MILTDCEIHAGASVERAILDKRVQVSKNAIVGKIDSKTPPQLVMIGKSSLVPEQYIVEPGGIIPAGITESDYPSKIIKSNSEIIRSKQVPYEI